MTLLNSSCQFKSYDVNKSKKKKKKVKNHAQLKTLPLYLLWEVKIMLGVVADLSFIRVGWVGEDIKIS